MIRTTLLASALTALSVPAFADPFPLFIHETPADVALRLVTRWPSLGAEVSRVVHGAAHGPERGLQILDAMPPDRVAGYQPWWAARLDLCLRAGDGAGAQAARARAIALTDDPAVRVWLAERV